MHIEIDLNGIRQVIAAQKLFEIAGKGIIGPETIVHIDGETFPAGKVKGIVFGKRRKTGGIVRISPSPQVVVSLPPSPVDKKALSSSQEKISVPTARLSPTASQTTVSIPTDFSPNHPVTPSVQQPPQVSIQVRVKPDSEIGSKEVSSEHRQLLFWSLGSLGFIIFCLVVWGPVKTLFQAASAKASSGLTLEETGIVAVVGGVVIIGLIIWVVARFKSTCPSCKKPWGKSVMKTVLVDSHLETRESVVTDVVRNDKWEVVGTVTRPTTKTVTVKTYEDHCRCVHCSHEWIYEYQKES